MPLPVMSFPILSPQQASPVLYGASNALNMANQFMQNQQLAKQLPFITPELQQKLEAQKLANALQQNTLNFAPQMSAAELAAKQAQPGLINAQAAAQRALPGLYGAESASDYANAARAQVAANLMRQQTPFLVQQEQEKLFSDPILSRLNQLNIAQRTGAIPQSSLSFLTGSGQEQPASSSQFSAVNPNLPAGASPVTTPKAFTGNDTATNWAMFGSPYNPIQMSAMQAQAKSAAETGVTSWNDAQKEAAADADLANNTNNLLNQFKSNYGKSFYKGSTLGTLPSQGKVTALMPGDLSAEQATDNASQNIAAAVAKLIAGGRVTNYEMQYINQLKPNRAMTPQTAQLAANFLGAKMSRLQQQQQFLNAARNQGIDVQTAQTLWQNYNNQAPVFNFNKNQPINYPKNYWKNFLTPQAVQDARQGNLPFQGGISAQSNNAPAAQPQIQTTKTIGGRQFVKINGGWYAQ
jgi:hypothetical protein